MLEVGTTIDVREAKGGTRPFTVRGRRGAGGQGIIYTLVATDGRPVVLKVPGAKGVVAAEIERRILAKLPPHRNVIGVVGTADVQGTECAVLEYAHENPFQRINRPELLEAVRPFKHHDSPRPAIPATTAVEILQELLAAVEHLHGSGFVHGDIKSQNLLVEVSSPRLRLTNREYFAAIQQRAYRSILIDFGTARSRAYLESTNTAQDEAVVPPEFTPLYAPPEIIRGIGDSRGGAAVDVYQIGLLFYEMLTGHYPYDHVFPEIHKAGLSVELLDLKKAERQGVRRPFDAERIAEARQHDVVFAEAFAAQRLKNRFYENARRLIDLATSPDPSARPNVQQLRKDCIRLFELEASTAPMAEGRPCTSMFNARWHLVRVNRLSEAARVPDAPEVIAAEVAPKKAPPAAPAGSPLDPHEAKSVPRADPRGFRVALVDDDKVTLTILAATLRRRGFKVRTFQDPESALEVLSRDHPDVAVFDMQMPGMTGVELVQALEKRIRAQPFPIMILSSEGQEATLAEAFYHGVTDYLVKPVSEAELVVKIENAHKRAHERPPELIPRDLAGFELGDEVRRGEVSVLFRASDPESPELVRAAKVLRPDLAGEAAPLLQLRREIDVVSRCDHPAIARVLATGLVGRLLFYVSDEVATKTLGERVRERGRLGVSEVVTLLRDVGGALKHLHGRLVFHGDLTPESIAFKDSGQIIIAELGMARWLDGVLRTDEPIPAANRYTAPELRASPTRPDPRSDLYALGACALESLLGRAPELMGARDAVDPRQLAQLPPDLSLVLARLVARSPEDRFPSAASLVAELARFQPPP